MSVYAHTVAWGRRPRLAPELSFRSPECGMFGRHLAEKLEPSGRSGGRSPYSESYYAGWIWCSGTSVKAVDFIHYDEKNNEWNLLQVMRHVRQASC